MRTRSGKPNAKPVEVNEFGHWIRLHNGFIQCAPALADGSQPSAEDWGDPDPAGEDHEEFMALSRKVLGLGPHEG